MDLMNVPTPVDFVNTLDLVDLVDLVDCAH